MRLGKISAAAVVALAMTSAPVFAQVASSASKLSVSKSVRAGAAVKKGSNEAAAPIGLLIAGGAAIVAGIVVVADGKNKPKSP